MYGFPQTRVSSMRSDYFSALGIYVGFWSSTAVVSCARNTHLQKKSEKVNVTPVAPAPSGAPPGQIHSGNQNKCCATLRPNAFSFCNARPRPSASDNKCSDKSNLFGKVPSRARETFTIEALQNSKRGNCHLASTKHLLLIMLEFRFAKFRGICTFQICIENEEI